MRAAFLDAVSGYRASSDVAAAVVARHLASFSPGGVIANLTVVVALPLAAGIVLRCLIPGTARFLAGDGAQRAASRTAIAAVAMQANPATR